MMTQRLGMMVLLVAVFALGTLLPAPWHMQAYAQSATALESGAATAGSIVPTTKVTGGSTITCDTLPEAQGGALLGKIVPCLTYTIEQSTVAFTAQMVSWLMPMYYVWLIFVVTLFGIRLLTNEPDVYKQGFLLLVKITITGAILGDLGNTAAYNGNGGTGLLIPSVYKVMSEAQNVVSGAISTSSLHCDVSNYGDAQTPKVWSMMDCVVGKLYGFTVSGGAGKPSMMLVTSVAGLLTGFLFGGAWGAAVFFGMLGVLFSILMLVVRTVVSFLVGYLIICLLIIMSPIFLPLAFMRGTSQYYDSYVRSVVAAFLTPIIITAFSMFALLVYDQMLFAPNSIVAKLFDYSQIKDAVQPSKKACDRHVTSDPLDVRFNTTPSATDKDGLFSLPNLQNLSFPTLSGGNDACNTVKLPVFKADKINGVPADEKQAMNEMFLELVELFLLAYLMSQAAQTLPDIVTQLVGRRATTSGMIAIVQGDGKIQAAYANARQTAITKIREATR